jgi:hypothetical protein
MFKLITMKKLLVLFAIAFICNLPLFPQVSYPVRGLCIAAPEAKNTDSFIKFINEELAPRNVNTLILRVDYNYQFESHPELMNKDGLTKNDVNNLVDACKKNSIRLIPQINLLGHQSWAEKIGKLLDVYPEFDETPGIKLPENYEWPNPDGLYCKSYCPLHPDLHKIIFDLVDEICDAFETDAFHAGMDEVFYIGHENCPRCAGHNKAELFAGEVNKIRDHLSTKNRQLWIWGDRLIDGKTTGIGLWEASENDTWPAIDLISKDVIICDWHYEMAVQTPVYFAMKGLSVISCPWRKPEVAVMQSRDMLHFRNMATPEMKDRYLGVMQTVWFSSERFIEQLKNSENKEENSEANCFRTLFNEINAKK